jgi:ribosomal protein L37AE/L43A
MQFPQEIDSHVSDFAADKVQAADPKRYKSARSLQALCRGYLTRMRRNVCYLCGQLGRTRKPVVYWACNRCLAAITTGTAVPILYDDQGYDTEGYDRAGQDRGGYDYYGFNRHGYDRQGNHYHDAHIDKDGEATPYGDSNRLRALRALARRAPVPKPASIQ